jgi:hypothetical protein
MEGKEEPKPKEEVSAADTKLTGAPEDDNGTSPVELPEETGHLTDEHRTRLTERYGIPDSRVDYWVEKGVLSSIDKDEAEKLLSWHNLQSGGILIRYLGSNAFLVRLDVPVLDKDGKQLRYLGPPKQPCALFNPGVDLETEPEIWITEGPLKAICGFEHGLQITALAGLWNWLNGPDNLTDEERLLSELKRDWHGTKFVLLTDSDIIPGHKAYEDRAFQRLASALYNYGAEEVRVVALPDLTPDEIDPETGKPKKTGLDEFIIAKGDQAKPELRELVDKTDPQPYWTLDRKKLLELLDNPPADLNEQLLRPPFYDVLMYDYIENNSIFSSVLWTKIKKARFPDFPGLKKAVAKDAVGVKGIRINGQPIVTDATHEKSSKPLDPIYNDLMKAMPAGHVITPLGGFAAVKIDDQTGKESFVMISDCVSWIGQEITKDDGSCEGEKEKFLVMECILPDKSRLPSTPVPKKNYGDMKWIDSKWDTRAVVYPYKEQDLKFIHKKLSQAGKVTKVTIYTHPGWQKVGDKWVYLFTNGAIGSEGMVNDIKVECQKDSETTRYRWTSLKLMNRIF